MKIRNSTLSGNISMLNVYEEVTILLEKQTDKQTGYPSIDKPWLKYYSDEAINAILPECSIYDGSGDPTDQPRKRQDSDYSCRKDTGAKKIFLQASTDRRKRYDSKRDLPPRSIPAGKRRSDPRSITPAEAKKARNAAIVVELN